MKIRIQDNSIRFRLTLKEVEELGRRGEVARETRIPSPAGSGGVFRYAVVHLPALGESEVVLDGTSITLRLSPADRAVLVETDAEGVYLRREWNAADGVQRFMAIVEKDRPASTCVKREEWIYDAPPPGPDNNAADSGPTTPLNTPTPSIGESTMQAFIDPTRSVAELLLENPSRARVFERQNIDYCCGGKRPLAAACAQRGLDVEDVASQLASCPDPVERSACAETAAISCSGLIRHIVDVHHALLRAELPRLAHLSEKVARAHASRDAAVVEIAAVFAAMRAELEAHMEKEERILFPFIESLEAGEDSPFPTILAPITRMEDDHTEVGAALARLRGLTGGYEPPPGACNSWRVLYHGLGELETDIHRHIHEENNILFPRALAMEKSLRGPIATRTAG